MVEVKTKITLKVGAKSKVPAEIASFTNLSSEKEHIAIIFNNADQKQPSPLVRIHSECLTGDVFHSSRCDCGEQLDEAINLMAKEGGVILYLRQEGRGIGLYNKIEAYKLQSEGLSTYQANNQLGFADDLREYEEAGQMLSALNIHRLKLFTNNPLKVKALQECGIEIEKVISTSTHLKEDNDSYLKAKAKDAGHDLKFS
ncbi:GTP cyclohydrolase-2 [Psychromonas marina]|uniref:GTP cyclohydrolase-2 n=1 Tax=Psychromonas marina TaxID=88364 RepID=A0ABQ6DXC9_9GAMM|nr:GTP cyclohydrolase II [Psychromonas marina]GLS89740.1 GTP cyclohydrolase-2 [Psychromonas marina]